MGGHKNRILRVNLSDYTFTEEPLSEGLIRDFIGGRGFGAKLLYDDLKPGVDPLGEDNELIFMAGSLAGTCESSGKMGHFRACSCSREVVNYSWKGAGHDSRNIGQVLAG